MDSSYDENDRIDQATEDAKLKIQCEDPCFKHSTAVLNVPVHLYNYGRLTEIEAAELSLKRRHLQFIREFDGYLVGFENLSLATGHGIIKDDMPYILWPIRGDFYTFHPIKGALIQGSIKSFHGERDDQVTCTISNGITAMVTFPVPISKKLSPFLYLSATITFQIVAIDSTYCQIAGRITEEAIEDMIKHAENE